MRSDTSRTLLLLAALACAEADEPLDSRVYGNSGSLCLSPRGAGGSHVQVLFDSCASTCDVVVAASCSASVTDGVIRVQSEATTRASDALECRPACSLLEAACTLPELADGNYELQYGGRIATVSMPVPIAGSLVLLAPEASPDDDPCELLPLLP